MAESNAKLTDPDYMYAGSRILRDSIVARNEEREEQRARAVKAEANAEYFKAMCGQYVEAREKAEADAAKLRAGLDKAIGAYYVMRTMANDAGVPTLGDWNDAERLILEAAKALTPEPGPSAEKEVKE